MFSTFKSALHVQYFFMLNHWFYDDVEVWFLSYICSVFVAIQTGKNKKKVNWNKREFAEKNFLNFLFWSFKCHIFYFHLLLCTILVHFCVQEAEILCLLADQRHHVHLHLHLHLLLHDGVPLQHCLHPLQLSHRSLLWRRKIINFIYIFLCYHLLRLDNLLYVHLF